MTQTIGLSLYIATPAPTLPQPSCVPVGQRLVAQSRNSSLSAAVQAVVSRWCQLSLKVVDP